MAETANEDPIRKHSDLLLRIIKEKAGIELDYSLGSLLLLDAILIQLFGKGMSRIPKDSMENLWNGLRIQIACYYGECIRETFSGTWAQTEDEGLCLKNISGMELTIFPLNTANDRLNGEDEKIFFAAKIVCNEVFKQMNEKVYQLGLQKSPAATPPPLPPH